VNNQAWRGISRITLFSSAAILLLASLPAWAGAGPDIRIEPLSLGFSQPNPKPIYIELDWMASDTHSHRPSQAVIDRMVDVFAAAGYALTVEVSDEIPHQDVFPIILAPSDSPAVQTLAATYFDRADDERYHWSLWIHNYSYNGVFSSSSGIGDLPGRVHIVSLGSFTGSVGTFRNQVGTFIHEFGHNIGQRHGGADNDNHKPNYLSVMNYHFQLQGIGAGLLGRGLATSASGIEDFNYSHGLLPSIDENALDERVGITLGPVDWDCDTTIEALVAQDVQAPDWCGSLGLRTALADFDNWASIESFISSAAPVQSASSGPCITKEENDLLLATWNEQGLELLQSDPQAELSRGGAPDFVLAPGSASFTVFNDGDAALTISSLSLDEATTWIKWTPPAPIVVAPGASQRIYVSADFDQAPAGTTNRRILVASDDPDENPYPGGVNLTVNGDGDCVLATSSSPAPGGATTGGIAAACGTPVIAKAFPAPGYHFVRWAEGAATASTAASYSFTLNATRNLEAEFESNPIFADGFESGTTGSWQ
jgi:hypothetical protein